jgi:hypothetical protein
MTRTFVAAVLALLALGGQARPMSQSSVPTKVPTTWGSSAPAGNITCPMPTASQISITAGRASWTDGFPPLNFLPISGGGVPPFGQDYNGVLCQLSQWTRWQNAGATVVYDATFSSAVGGYPKGAVLQNASNAYCVWISQADNNSSDPDTGGANWTGACPGAGVGGTSTGSGNAQVIAATPFVLQATAKVCWIAGFTNTGATQINVNGAGLTNVLIRTQAGLVALSGGEIHSGMIACGTYDGTQYELDVSAAWASLTQPDQTLSGGANVNPYPIGTLASQTYQIDCGKGPLQYFTNNGAITLSAPANDGSCLLYDLNAGSAGTITFSGFTVNSNTGEPLTNTNTNKFAITVWRINGVSSYLIKALQ